MAKLAELKALAADLRKRLRQVDQLTGRSSERDRDTRRKRELRAASKEVLVPACEGPERRLVLSGRPLPLVPRRRASLGSRQEVDKQAPTFKVEVRRPTALQQLFCSFNLERSFTVLGFIVAVLLISVLGLDLIWGWPFRHASLLFDAGSVICGAALAS